MSWNVLGMFSMQDAAGRVETTRLSVSWLGRAGLMLAAGLTLFAVVLVWRVPALEPVAGQGRWRLLGLGLAHAAAAFILQRLLASFPRLGRVWPSRLGFGSGSLLAVALWLAGFVGYGNAWPFWSLLVAGMGTFLGGLLATILEWGLCEVSFPPARHIVEGIRQHHLRQEFSALPEPPGKLLFDRLLALIALVLSLPLWLLSAFLIWLEDPGPIFFIKNSVGKEGINFQQIKFRSMVCQAEIETGPVPALAQDPRILRIGRFLRKTALDELPQLINILRGEMSFVGPRPLRTVVVYDYLQDLPQFAERHRVRPGITGLSQVIGGYYVTPLQRLHFDRIYIRHMRLAFDLQLLLLTVMVLWLRWRSDADRHGLHRWVQRGKGWRWQPSDVQTRLQEGPEERKHG